MKTISKMLLVLGVMLGFFANISPSHAAVAGAVTLGHIYEAGGTVYVAAASGTSLPTDCQNSNGDYFQFDSTTSSGKNILVILLSAATLGKNVQIWYEDTCSTAPGVAANMGSVQIDF